VRNHRSGSRSMSTVLQQLSLGALAQAVMPVTWEVEIGKNVV
jgi:hypothetical protein